MLKSDIKQKQIPEKPGVYFFIGSRRQILYIGKATSLKHRVLSYFDSAIKNKRSSLIEKMVFESKTVEWTETDSVIEALLLETNLIRTHKPFYNTRSKDDKSYNHLVITDEEFPRVLVMRSKDLKENITDTSYSYVFGPYPNGAQFKEALKIVRKLFQFYDTQKPIDKELGKLARGKIDFNRQIGLYPSSLSKQEYNQTIRHIRLFFQSKKSQIIKELTREMMRLATREEFERAHEIKHKIFALKHIEDIALMKDESRIHRDDRSIRIEAYDIAHLSGTNMVGVMTVVEGGEMQRSEYRKFIIQTVTGPHDTGALREVLERRLTHAEWTQPQLMVVDGSTAQVNVALRVLKKKALTIPVVGVVKDERHRPVRIVGPRDLIKIHETGILLANAEAHRFAITFHKTKRSKSLLKP
jgi:excinuclease ABC subunit C